MLGTGKDWMNYFKDISNKQSNNPQPNGTIFHDDYLAFWDTMTDRTNPHIKLFAGLVPDKQNNIIPGIVFGAGDGQGNNRAYIQKDETGFELMYRTPNMDTNGIPIMSGIKFNDDGTININDSRFSQLTNPDLISEYLEASELWNKKLDGLVYNAPIDTWQVPYNKLDPGTTSYWDGKLDPEEQAVWDALTQNGKMQGLYKDEATGNYYLHAKYIKSGQITVDYIDTRGLGAEKVYMPLYPKNYAQIGGEHGDLILNYNNAEYFRVSNDMFNTELQRNGVSFISSSGSNTYPKGNWNFNINDECDNVQGLEDFGYVYCSDMNGNKSDTNNVGLRVNPSTMNMGIYVGGVQIGYIPILP